IGELAVLALAGDVGQLAEGEEVGLVVEENAVVEGEALARLDLFADGGDAVVRGHVRSRGGRRNRDGIRPVRPRFQGGSACPPDNRKRTTPVTALSALQRRRGYGIFLGEGRARHGGLRVADDSLHGATAGAAGITALCGVGDLPPRGGAVARRG